MVWPFKKKKVIDLTQGGVKIPASIKTRLEGYKDLTPSPDASSESAFGFLGNLASASESSSNTNLLPDDLSLRHLKVKIEDIEYKLDSLTRRLTGFIDRLDLAEKKIDRNERRGI